MATNVESRRKDDQIRIRVSRAEKTELRRRARAAKKTLSRWMVERCLKNG